MLYKLAAIAISAYLLAVGVIYVHYDLYPPEVEEEIRVVPPEEVVRALSLGHEGFAADLLLSDVTIHSGSLMWKPLRIKFDHEWAYSMVDLVTDLDPKFFTAYLFAGMGLIHDFDDVERAKPILEKGMQVFPERWELPFWIGYNYYSYLQEFEKAGKYLWQAYNKPDAPKRFLSLMLSTLRKAGDYEKALEVINEMYESTEQESLKAVYAKRMAQLENLLALQKAARTYQEVRGHPPESLQVMVQEGLLPEIPEDPFGMSYEMDPESEALVVLEGQEKQSSKKRKEAMEEMQKMK